MPGVCAVSSLSSSCRVWCSEMCQPAVPSFVIDRMLFAAGEVPVEVVDDVARVVFDPVDERRLSTPQDRQAERVQPWAVDGAAVVAEVALRVDDRYFEPA